MQTVKDAHCQTLHQQQLRYNILNITANAVTEVLMDKADLQILINSKKELFLKKLKYAGLNDLEYWEKRPENLSREILVKYLSGIDETKELFPEMTVRESDGGKYGETGFKWVFKFKDTFSVLGRKTEIYMKGFFFEENDPRGIEVQSFKKDKI